jgi:hypothetical protein
LAQALVLVCDECGKPDATSVTIRAGDKNYVKDLCTEHLRALLKHTRAPRRGRPIAAASPSKSSRSPRTRSARTTRKRAAAGKRVTARKRATGTRARKRTAT